VEWSVKGCDLPAEGRELAGDGDGDARRALAAFGFESAPALVEAALRAARPRAMSRNGLFGPTVSSWSF
jgi:hypothetical protein